MRQTFVIRNGELVAKRDAAPLHVVSGCAPAVISDGLPDLLNHADGRRYDSKRGFERAVRACGFEIIGNEQPSTPRPEPTLHGVGSELHHRLQEAGH